MSVSSGKKPRILIFSIAYVPLIGGAELAVRELTDRLPQYHFDLITCRFNKAHLPKETIGNVDVYRVGFGNRLGRHLFPVFAFRQAQKLHKVAPYQLIWSIMAAYAGAAALAFLSRHKDAKFLLTLQEGDSIEHIYRRVKGFTNQWRRLFSKADRIQVISKFLADWAKKEGATNPIDIIPNGVDLEAFRSAKARGAKRRESHGPLIISVSRLVPKNGVDILIHAAKRLTFLTKDRFKIRILGSGPEKANLLNLVRKSELEEIVDFLGDIDPKQVPDYLADADLFVRPSRSEGLGSAFLEAMAAGLPVIGTNVGGIPDFLIDNETGLMARVDDPQDLAEKILLLLNNKQLSQKLADTGRQLVEEKYSWDTIALRMHDLFKKLIR